jgi:hypothetical protein
VLFDLEHRPRHKPIERKLAAVTAVEWWSLASEKSGTQSNNAEQRDSNETEQCVNALCEPLTLRADGPTVNSQG